MSAVDIIRQKRQGEELSIEEITDFVQGATALAQGQQTNWTDYQLGALLMAIFCRGMSANETANLTRAMTNSGHQLDWGTQSAYAVDKHSTGGVGDKTSLILAPLAACCGVLVPMISGRGLGHTGGTLDKLEAIPGFRVHLSESELKEGIDKIGVVMIGQSAQIAPADRSLYALRDVTATVESIPLITASILSKKLAEGIKGLVMDVKFGLGAFMKTQIEALQLADSLRQIGEKNGLNMSTFLTRMDSPLGRMIGNALEVREVITILKGEAPKEDINSQELIDLSLRLAAKMVLLAGKSSSLANALTQVKKALDSGQALEKFREIIRYQGGDEKVIDDPDRLPSPGFSYQITAQRSGYLTGLHAEKLGRAALNLGAGRHRKEDPIDHAVGICLHASPGTFVHSGEPILQLMYQTQEQFQRALSECQDAIDIQDEPLPRLPRIEMEN